MITLTGKKKKEKEREKKKTLLDTPKEVGVNLTAIFLLINK